MVGHPKCGTTALYQALSRHPEIFLARPKEPHYLATELRHRPEWGEFGGLPKDLDEYLSLYDGAKPGQLAGEASAWYLWSQTAAAEIAALNPEAKIVAILREPAAFLRSLHLQLVQAHVEPENDFGRALDLEEARQGGDNPAIPASPRDWPQILPAVGGLVYADYVRYLEQLARYEEHFPAENLLVLIYDDFRSDNEATIERVLRFLGVNTGATLDVPEANPSVQVRSRRANDMLRSLYMGDGAVAGRLKRGVKAVVPSRKLRRLMVERTQHKLLYTSPESIDEALAARLRQRFRPEVEALGEHLGRDLVSLWDHGGEQ